MRCPVLAKLPIAPLDNATSNRPNIAKSSYFLEIERDNFYLIDATVDQENAKLLCDWVRQQARGDSD